jgi:hypothetical protein
MNHPAGFAGWLVFMQLQNYGEWISHFIRCGQARNVPRDGFMHYGSKKNPLLRHTATSQEG